MANKQRIEVLEYEILKLKHRLLQSESELQLIKSIQSETPSPNSERLLTNDEIARYSRQIILPQIGVGGQLKLKTTSFLVVGAGGLGCPALLYLVSAGVENIGIVDYDVVEKNNLHRQILHNESTLGIPKALSAMNALLKLNSSATIVAHEFQLSSTNALDIINSYDVVLDCSDNVATRYLLNDACSLTGRPLVSGSALQFEGQLTVYNYKQGPCYRCIFPTPPPPETVTNCGDGGVIGAVTGIIGSLQALEAIKIALNLEGVLTERLLLFDGIKSSFRNVRLRSRRKDCDVCSEKPIITRLIDYEQFCEMRASDKDFALSILEDSERISVIDYKKLSDSKTKHLLIDVRNPIEFEICHLENSINIPLKKILEDKNLDDIKTKVQTEKIPVFLLCRRGNDSQLAVQHLREKLRGIIEPKDIIGGLHAWHYKIDKSFPIY